MDSQILRDHIVKRIEGARDSYINDFEALDESELSRSMGGVARSAYDFTYEVTFVNRRIATRLRGGTPESFGGDGWITAPEEFRSKAALLKALEETMDDVIAAWKALPESEYSNAIVTPNGSMTPLDLASLCATHAMYHDAQLNFIQALVGDDEMHWD